MSSPLDVLRDHRKRLIERLVTRSPMLNFGPGAYREDVCKLFQGVTPNIPALLDDCNGATTTPRALVESLAFADQHRATIRGAARPITAKCRKIRQEADEYRHATGQHSLFLGFPLVFAPREGQRYVLAPLFLWPILIAVPTPDVVEFSLLRDEDDMPLEPRFNRIFAAWLSHEEGVQIALAGNDEEIGLDNIDNLVRQILRPWTRCEKEAVRTEISNIPPKRPALEEWARNGREPVVKNWAVIGYGSFKGQALLDDLDKMENLLESGLEQCGVLKNFIFPREELTAHEVPEPQETEKWLVTEADHSQEAAVWQARKGRILVLHGPPGTGKSQTIVNLIADALEDRKRVAVICQKRPALDVLRKRLAAVGLGEFAELIDDVSKDRVRVINHLRSINTDYEHRALDDQREQASRRVVELERRIDEFRAGLNDTKNGNQPRYSELLARRERWRNEGIDVARNPLATQVDAFGKIGVPRDNAELERLAAEIGHFDELWRQCDYRTNPWARVSRLPVGVTQMGRAEALLSEVRELADQFAQLDGGRLHPLENAWIALHSWASSFYDSFLHPEQREVEIAFRRTREKIMELENWFQQDALRELVQAVRERNATARVDDYLNKRGWVSTVMEIREQVRSKPLLQALESCWDMFAGRWRDVVRAMVYHDWIRQVEESYPAIGNTTAGTVGDLRSRLAAAVQQKQDLDRIDIRNRFGERVIYRDNLDGMNLLRLRGAGRIRKTTIRALYHRGFQDLHRLRPVLLTNPETASAILELEPGLYDLVIIDEASQMFTADALPMLFRAKAVVISGDNMQMPPSDFFVIGVADDGGTDLSDEDKEEIAPDANRLIPAEGAYSLLDAAEYAVQTRSPANKRLLVHYRSERKELIDFSNHAFYEGKLIVPTGNKPLPPLMRAAIVLEKVEGKFTGGVNPEEAHKILQTIEEIWRQDDPPSLGVIVFNVNQRDLIEELLIERAQDDGEFASKLERERNRIIDLEDQGFFVRSVEHVQGDERDIIILGTTYGNDTRRFGPISVKEKGRRRLNVAVTRARLGMFVISSLDIDHISNEAQREDKENYYFWKYMCYARAVDAGDEEATAAILNGLNPDRRISEGRTFESEFERDVAAFLRDIGYYVVPQVGESGFRIDLGVKKGSVDGRYRCGIECDSKQYHSGWRARLNDVWRQEILEQKGWNIIRIWGPEWYGNPGFSKRRLREKLNAV